MQYADVSLEVELDILQRLLRLRRAGRVGIIHADGGHYAISDDPLNIDGSKHCYTVPRLRELVERLENV